MTTRLSNWQYSILRATHESSGLPLTYAVKYNQIGFISLVQRGLLKYNLGTEAFTLTKDGKLAEEQFRHPRMEDLLVKNQSPRRKDKIHDKYHKHPKAKAA